MEHLHPELCVFLKEKGVNIETTHLWANYYIDRPILKWKLIPKEESFNSLFEYPAIEHGQLHPLIADEIKNRVITYVVWEGKTKIILEKFDNLEEAEEYCKLLNHFYPCFK